MRAPLAPPRLSLLRTVEADAGLGWMSAVYTYDLIPTDTLDLGFGVGAGVLALDTRWRSDTVRLSVEGAVPVGLVGIHLASDLGGVRLNADLAGGGLVFGQ